MTKYRLGRMAYSDPSTILGDFPTLEDAQAYAERLLYFKGPMMAEWRTESPGLSRVDDGSVHWFISEVDADFPWTVEACQRWPKSKPVLLPSAGSETGTSATGECIEPATPAQIDYDRLADAVVEALRATLRRVTLGTK